MNEALAKLLKSNWKPVSSKGGWFALAPNGFPKKGDAVPALAVDPKKEIKKGAIKKLGKDEEIDATKEFLGRISVEDGQLVFSLDPASPAKAPSLLKKCLKQLAASKEAAPGVNLNALKSAIVMGETEVSLEGEASLDSAESAEKAGGKVSLAAKLNRSSYSKLLDDLKTWGKTYHNKLTAQNVDAGEKLIKKIRGECDEWLEKHKDEEGSGDRAKELRKIKAEAQAAQKAIDAFKTSLKNQRDDNEADAWLEEALANEKKGKPEERQEGLAKAQRSLARRLADPNLDPDEREELSRQAKEVLRVAAADQAALLRKWKNSEFDPKAIGGDTFGKAAEQTRALLIAMRESGQGDAADEYIRQTFPALNEVRTASIARQADAGGNWENTLNRANDPVLKLSTELVKATDPGFGARTFKDGLKLLDENPQVDPTRGPLNDKGERELPASGKRLADEFRKVQDAMDKMEEALATAALSILGDGADRAEVLSLVKELTPEPDLRAGADQPKMPSPATVAGAWLQRNPKKQQAHADKLAAKALAVLRGMVNQTGDIVGKETEAALPGLALAAIQADGKADESDVLEALFRDRLDLVSPALEQIAGGAIARLRDDLDEERKALRKDASRALKEMSALRDGSLAEAQQGFDEDAGAETKIIERAYKSVMDALIADAGAIPKPIRLMAQQTWDAIAAKGGKPEVGQRAVADLLMLRWLAPQFATRQASGDGGAVRNDASVLVSKLLQNTANGVLPGGSKEPLLGVFRGLVADYLKKWQGFALSVVDADRQERKDLLDQALRDHDAITDWLDKNKGGDLLYGNKPIAKHFRDYTRSEYSEENLTFLVETQGSLSGAKKKQLFEKYELSSREPGINIGLQKESVKAQIALGKQGKWDELDFEVFRKEAVSNLMDTYSRYAAKVPGLERKAITNLTLDQALPVLEKFKAMIA